MRHARPQKNALVLSGGGARGAYEVGIVRYLREELPRRIGRQPRLDILCGTSVGSINAAFLAATAHQPDEQAARVVAHWRKLGTFRARHVAMARGASATGSTGGRDLSHGLKFAVLNDLTDFCLFDSQTVTDRPCRGRPGVRKSIGQAVMHENSPAGESTRCN